ncbi:MAG: hypothetical protein ACTJLL_01910 [Anaplasma sp.]
MRQMVTCGDPFSAATILYLDLVLSGEMMLSMYLSNLGRRLVGVMRSLHICINVADGGVSGRTSMAMRY